MINVGILGYGTVGSGVFDILRDNKDIIAERAGEEISVKYVLDLRDFPGDSVESVLVHDFQVIDADDDIQIVVETMGGLHPAYEFVKACLEKGKSVCTSNKALVADFGPELIQIAKDNHASFLFEASVGGGIPIVRPLQSSLSPDDILEISGILNGTTNYILTEMKEKGADFDSVLKDAQNLGYAEADPTADVEGQDACRKISILTSLAYGKNIDFHDIYTEGITKITDKDIAYANKLGSKVKIFGSSRKEGNQVSAMVAPVMIYPDNPLYSVDGVFNAILVKGNMVGDVMFYGQGAGKFATASAVVSDVIEAGKNIGVGVPVQWTGEKLSLVPFKDCKSRFFVRMAGTGSENEKRVQELFGKVQAVDAGFPEEYAFITEEMTEEAYEKASQASGNVINQIRVCLPE